MTLLGATAAHATEFVIPDGDTAQLKSAIALANANNQDDTIRLAANGNYVLTQVDNTTFHATGLPIITSDNGHTLTIVGNGATLARSSAPGTPPFRLLCLTGATADISSLTLVNGELQITDSTVTGSRPVDWSLREAPSGGQ